jgi:hypothetical protein
VLFFSYGEYYNQMTLRVVVNALRAFNKNELDRSVDSWRQTRHLAMLYYNSKAKHQIKNPVDYMALPGERKPKPITLSTKAFEKLIVQK